MGYASYFEDIRDKSNNGLECVNKVLSAIQILDSPQLKKARKWLEESKQLFEKIISIANGVDLLVLRKLDNIEKVYHDIRRRKEEKYKQKNMEIENQYKDCLDELALYRSIIDDLCDKYPDICYELFPPFNDR